jgi:hypothetical protein
MIENLIKVMRILMKKNGNMIIMGLECTGKKTIVRMSCKLLGIKIIGCMKKERLERSLINASF